MFCTRTYITLFQLYADADVIYNR